MRQSKDIVCWFSGGVTSAVACKIAIELFGKDRCRVIFIDTKNEHSDSYRFLSDCEKWYNLEIEKITAIPEKYNSIQDVWLKFKGMNFANGAICSSELKRAVRLNWQKENDYTYQVFGFDIDEPSRSKSMTANYPQAKAVDPLLFHGLTKEACIEILNNESIDIPEAYKLGFRNNNCLGTGCVQGGIGYWQLMRDIMPQNFDSMAEMEHYLTDLKGEPVTMLKDQSKEAKAKVKATGLKWKAFIFLKPHKDYPELICIDDKPRQKVKPLFECNGFGCAVNDLEPRNETENEINYGAQFSLKL